MKPNIIINSINDNIRIINYYQLEKDYSALLANEDIIFYTDHDKLEDDMSYVFELLNEQLGRSFGIHVVDDNIMKIEGELYRNGLRYFRIEWHESDPCDLKIVGDRERYKGALSDI